MGICKSTVKLNGIIQNQSSYEIIYHVSGSMKQLIDYEEELNLGPKIGVGMDNVGLQGINYNQKRLCKNQKYHSVARIPKHSYCSVGLNDIQVGCFLSIYASKLNEQGKQVHKKLIFKDICIRTNQDICLRINKDLTVKQLAPSQIASMKAYFQKQGTTIISTLKQTTDILKSENQSITEPINRLSLSTEYVRKKFGSSTQRYLRFLQTGLYDLNHIGVKLDVAQFLKYDWVYLSSLQLDNCGLDDNEWHLLSENAQYYFPNLKNLYLGIAICLLKIADNKISKISDDDLEHFPALKTLQLDYSQTQGINPLTEDSKGDILDFAIAHPDIQIFCASIDESKYIDIEQLNKDQINEYLPKLSESQIEDFQQYLQQNPQVAKNMGWYWFLPPQANSTRQEPQEIKKSKIGSKKKKKEKNKINPKQNLSK